MRLTKNKWMPERSGMPDRSVIHLRHVLGITSRKTARDQLTGCLGGMAIVIGKRWVEVEGGRYAPTPEEHRDAIGEGQAVTLQSTKQHPALLTAPLFGWGWRVVSGDECDISGWRVVGERVVRLPRR